jgi:4-alpha-glucanotransferase
MPVSSLPSPYGLGVFGKAAYAFVDFLRGSGQRYWQVLPLSPTSYGDSPYQSPSAFAGNPYFIDLDLLKETGLLKAREINAVHRGEDPAKVDYNAIYKSREKILRKAFSRFDDSSALEAFRLKNMDWLEDYALFMAIKARMKMRPWPEWPAALRLREAAALAEQREKLKTDIDYHIFAQYLFFKQWNALKAYANENSVLMIGDIPIYVAMDSADSWSRSEYFLLDEERQPIDVSGCPPDAFSKDGQLWGNPLYRWDVLKADGYSWWLKRLHSCLSMYDVLRIDHFRGLESYYAIPYGRKNARVGEWREGPGQDFINAINRELPEAEIIAEDLGFLTSAVRRLLRNSGYPGMKVLQFAFDANESSDYMPHNYDRRCVVYTGTHDNDTSLGWFASSRRKDVAVARRYLGIKRNAEGADAMIRAAFSSVANLAVAPMQDWLGLGGQARMNTPSTLGGDNWRWRMAENAATPELAERIFRTTRLYGRLINVRKG